LELVIYEEGMPATRRKSSLLQGSGVSQKEFNNLYERVACGAKQNSLQLLYLIMVEAQSMHDIGWRGHPKKD
jgi:hypothetical protein